MSKKLVAYFSASGVTREAARRLADAAGADLFEIKPKEPYTTEDLDWTNKMSRSSIEMKNPDSRPEIADKVSDIDAYGILFIGFPIWWYVAPTIINTFLESYDLTGKTIIPFATSGGSGFGKTMDILRNCSTDAKWLPGKMLNGVSDGELESWLRSLDIR